MRRIILSAALMLSLLAPVANALNVADTTVVLPIIGRFAGAFGTQWHTDVFIANPYSPIANVTMTFDVAGDTPRTTTVAIGPFSDVSLPDIVLNKFALATAAGQLIISCPTSVEARARIYNTGNPAGQFGQNVPGLGMATLRTQAFLYGLSGIDGNRLNIGVANPNASAIAVTLIVSDKNHVMLHNESITLQAHETRQINDVFSAYGITPQDSLQVEFDSPSGAVIYGYASEVRNDTGDAIFVFGTGPNV
jgi:hypothetical protein